MVGPLALMTVLAAGLAACHDTAPTGPEPQTPTSVTLVAGDTQTVFTDSTLLLPLTVLVTNQNGNHLAGIPVSWAIVSGGGTLSDSVTTTNPDGHGLVQFTAGSQTGDAIIDGTVAGLPAVAFHITIEASPDLNTVEARR
jgi:hypothetical protein